MNDQRRSKKHILLWGVLFMAIGFMLGAEELILGDLWTNTTTLTYISNVYPQDINVSGINATKIYINNDPVCTQNNGLCTSGSGNTSWNESKYWSNASNTFLYNTGVCTDSNKLNGQLASFYYPASNPSGFISSYTETDPISSPEIINAAKNITQVNTTLNNEVSNRIIIDNNIALNVSWLNNSMVSIGNFSGNASTWATCSAGTVSYWNGYVFTCVTDQTGSGGGNVNGSDIFQRNINASGFINSESGLTQHGGVPVIDTQTLFCDFNVPYITTMCYPNYLITIATGVPIKAPNAIISNYRNGVLNFTTTAAVNTGAAILTDPTNFLINGSEMYQAGLRFPMLALTGNKSVVHAGFMDTTATQTESVDGAYFYIVNHTGGGRVSNNSIRLYTTTNYTFNTRDWYDMRIDIAPNGTQARFTIYNGSKGASLTPLYQQNITGTNFLQFPQLSGRETGAGVACGITTAGQVMTPCQIDYVHTEIEKQRRPGLMP